MKVRLPYQVSKREKEAIRREAHQVVLETNEQYSIDVDAMVLYTLHVHLGFGKKRLRAFWDAFQKYRDDLIKHYQMPDDYVWLCRYKLKEIGVDVELWNKELNNDHD